MKILTIILTISLFLIIMSIPAQMRTLPPIVFETMEEYKNFIKENRLPGNFVYYESISMLGEFEQLRFNPTYGYEIEEIRYYLYTIGVEKKDINSKEGGRLIFTVSHVYNEEDIYGECNLAEIDSDNLLLLPYNSYYELDGVVYVKDKNGYYSIKWEKDELLFEITPYAQYNVYAPDSFIGKLLDKNTAPEAIEFLKNYNFTGKPTEPTPPETADFSPIFPILSVISAGGFTAFAVTGRKKKKKE